MPRRPRAAITVEFPTWATDGAETKAGFMAKSVLMW
jgi:hypothetical protein